MSDLWSKSTGESLLQHIESTVVVLNKLCDSLSMSPVEKSSLLSVLKRIGAIHDIGKAASGFQNALKENKSWGHRHEILSTAVASVIFHDLSHEALMAIATHHRNVPESLATENERCLPLNELPFENTNPVWDSMVNEWLERWDGIKDILSIMNELYDLKIADIPNQFTFKGLGLPEKILHRIFQKKVDGFNRKYASLLRGLLMTADHLASAHQFDLPQIPVQKDYISIIHRKELKENAILPFQKRTAATTGDSILKAPTGSGKTLAILLWAASNQSGNGRLFYVLPHTASINAMHGRLRDIYGEKNVGVLHHKSAAYLLRLFENDHSTIDAAKMAKTVSDLARELYHPIRVTTPHQILRVALQGKGWELGLAEFPNACFVFDEIHAFEPLLVGLTIATIKWLKRMGAKVLFASATLPLFLENILKQEIGIPEQNIITPDLSNADDKAVLDKIRHKIDIRPGSLLSNIDDIIEEIQASGFSVLIVCNHVITSQQVWQLLDNSFKGEVELLHSRFNSRDRMNIESKIQGDNRPRILVATQAVEVSLDLDYDCGYIEPAPADALGQRLGRINRKGSRPHPAPVVIFNEPSLKTKKDAPMYLPYDKDITIETIKCLCQYALLTEQQLTDTVNTIYGNGYKGDSLNDYERGLKNSMINNFDENIIAGTHKDWVADLIDGSDGQIEVLPMDLYNDFVNLKTSYRHLEARLLLVPIQMRQAARLFRDGDVFRDNKLGEFITNLSYSPHLGLDLSRQSENVF
jgi:CRISPR-associated endonuclease/helicase Cas3